MSQRKVSFTTQSLQGEEKETVSLSDAIIEARNMINKVDEFRNGKELQRKEEEAEDARDSIWAAVTMLVTVISPVLSLLGSVPMFWPLAAMAWAIVLAALPSKEQALEKARES